MRRVQATMDRLRIWLYEHTTRIRSQPGLSVRMGSGLGIRLEEGGGGAFKGEQTSRNKKRCDTSQYHNV